MIQYLAIPVFEEKFFDLSEKDSRLSDEYLTRLSQVLAKHAVRSFNPKHFEKHCGSFSALYAIIITGPSWRRTLSHFDLTHNRNDNDQRCFAPSACRVSKISG